MNALVVYSSKHGATAEIAARIGSRLTAHGLQADVVDVTKKPNPAAYDAVVLGSAVYIGAWRKDALEFARKHAAELRSRPVWLFSSGPLAQPGLEDPTSLAELTAICAPRDHHIFAGALDKKQLSIPERFVIAAVAAQMKMELEGDFRAWDDMDSWADGIANALVMQPAGVAS